MTRALTYAVGIVAVGGFVALASLGALASAAALVLAIGLVVLVSVGPERLGAVLILLAMFTAPQNSLRPLASADFVTFSDLFLVAGLILLLPILLRTRTRLPVAFVIGGILLTISVFVSSLLSPDPGVAFLYGPRLIAAVVALPLVFLLWRPPPRMIDLLAWAFVAGQVVSTAYAALKGQIGDRSAGLTTHPNFFGLGALMSTCLLIHLFARTTPRRRWIVWVAGVVCLSAIVMSGSRAAAIVIFVIVLLYPLLERSLISAYFVVAGALAFVAVGDRVLAHFSDNTLLDRLQGNAGTNGSDQQRRNAIDIATDKFFAHPLLGGGFDAGSLDAHSIYLEVVVGVGVFGLVAYLLVMWTSVKTLLLQGDLHRLGYAALAYGAVGLLTNSLWDRFVWMVVSLSFLAHIEGRDAYGAFDSPDEVASTDPAPLDAPRPALQDTR